MGWGQKAQLPRQRRLTSEDRPYRLPRSLGTGHLAVRSHRHPPHHTRF